MSTRSQNHPIVWVGRDVKTHLLPIHLPRAGTHSTRTAFSKPRPTGPWRWKIAVQSCIHHNVSTLSVRDKKVEQCPSAFPSRRWNSATRSFSRVSPAAESWSKLRQYFPFTKAAAHAKPSSLTPNTEFYYRVTHVQWYFSLQESCTKENSLNLVYYNWSLRIDKRLNHRKISGFYPWKQEFVWLYMSVFTIPSCMQLKWTSSWRA